MEIVKQIDIKNQTYYFYNGMVDIKKFDSNLLKIDKKSYKDIGIYNYIYKYIEEKDVNKFLVFNSTDENKELLKKYNDVFSGIINKMKKVNGDKCDYEKDYMKIKFNLDNDLPLNKQLKFHNMAITIRSVFEEDSKLYPPVFLDDTLYELNI